MEKITLYKRSLKIALPSSSFLPSIGGAEVGLHNICLKLIKKGHIPFVITSYSHYKKLKIMNLALPYKVISLPPKISIIFEKNYKLGFFFFNIFYGFLQKKYQFDFWHATFGYPIGVSVINYCLKKEIPHLVRCVGEDIQIEEKISYGYRINKKIDNLLKKSYVKSDCMIAVSNSIKSEFLKIGVKKKNIKLISNGVDLDRMKRFNKLHPEKKKKSLSVNEINFLSLGRYHVKKNFELLVSVYEKLIKEKYKFKAIIAGSNMDNLKEIVKNKGIDQIIKVIELEKKIKNINQIPNNQVLELYNNTDCFIMPSKIESFGIVTIEAMSFGIPIIAANSPGNKDILDNGNYGLIYDNSENDLFRKIKSVLKNRKILKKLSKLSGERVIIYDWSVIVDKYINLYYQLIKKKN